MHYASDGSPSRFPETFPQRFADALAEARGALAGIVASGGRRGGGLIDARSLHSLHELYRLRIELELETAGVLWRTAEVVAAMADVLELLGRADAAVPPESIEGRRRAVEPEQAAQPLRRAA